MVEKAESLTRPDMGEMIPAMVLNDDRCHFLVVKALIIGTTISFG
jgi:hypothetical protein